MRFVAVIVLMGCGVMNLAPYAIGDDYIRDLQTDAINNNHADFGHWGHDPGNYKLWGTHSNRLIPVYTFGAFDQAGQIDLKKYSNEKRKEDQMAA